MASKLGRLVDLFGKLACKCAASICFLLLFDSSRDTRYKRSFIIKIQHIFVRPTATRDGADGRDGGGRARGRESHFTRISRCDD